MLGAVVPMDVFLCAQKVGEGVFARAQPHVVLCRRRRAAGEGASAALAACSTQSVGTGITMTIRAVWMDIAGELSQVT